MLFARVLFIATVPFAIGQSQNESCDPISKYTTQWFLNNYTYKPAASSGLFYTYGLAEAAQAFAARASMTTVWDMWPCNLYDGDTGGINNPLRCIFSDDNLRKTYFENISRAMAQLCDVLATVMTADPNNIPLTGIWGRVEFPALQQTGNSGGQANAIFAVDAEGKNMVSV